MPAVGARTGALESWAWISAPSWARAQPPCALEQLTALSHCFTFQWTCWLLARQGSRGSVPHVEWTHKLPEPLFHPLSR